MGRRNPNEMFDRRREKASDGGRRASAAARAAGEEYKILLVNSGVARRRLEFSYSEALL